MDTPGVLSRPDGERNEMEALTLASMQHLPTAVVFVMDLSGHSGHLSSLENQVHACVVCRTAFGLLPFLWLLFFCVGMVSADAAVPCRAVLYRTVGSRKDGGLGRHVE